MHSKPADEPRTAAKRGVHLPALDGLRGFALLLVVLYHVLLINEHAGSALISALADIRRSLWIGVDLFIALSGFLITGILFDALGDPHFLRRFYVRRCLRILPVYVLAIATLSLLAWRNHVPWLHSAGMLCLFLQNTPAWFRHPPPFPLDAYTSHLWSIALEEQFYLCWPFAVLLLRERRRIMGAALLVAGLALLVRLWLVHRGVGFDVTYKMLPCRADGFLLGGFLALALRGDGEESAAHSRLLRLAPWLFAAAAGTLLYAGVREGGLDWHDSRFANGAGYTVIALLCTSLLGWTLVPGSPPQTVFRAGFLRVLGRYSYGIYVWHVILGQSATHPARVFATRFTGNTGVQMLAGAAAACVYSFVLGVLSWHAVEAWFLRLKRRVPMPHVRRGLPADMQEVRDADSLRE